MTENQENELPANVIRGPWQKRVLGNPSEAELRLIEEMQFCEDFSRKLIMDLVEILGEHDVDISEKSFSRDIAVVLEFTKSLLYRDCGLEHPMHEFIDVFTDVEVELDNSVKTIIRADLLKQVSKEIKELEDDGPEVS
jgi:hypothetical protein